VLSNHRINSDPRQRRFAPRQHETFAAKLSSVRALPQHKKTSSGVQNFAVSEGYRNRVIKGTRVARTETFLRYMT
jgi:hypothetical protein